MRTPMPRRAPVSAPARSPFFALLSALAIASCGGEPDEARPTSDSASERSAVVDTAPTRPGTPRPTTTVVVYFTRDERPVPVQRVVPPTRDTLRAAILALLEGPTPEERAAGLTSFFSEQTAGMLNAATIDEHGHAVVDLEDLRPVIPNASTSTGSTIFLGELNSTAFAIPRIRSVEYRIDGNCDAFWEWLQYGRCQIVNREAP